VWSVVLSRRSVTVMSSAKTAEPIKMPFGLRTQVGPRNHVLDGVQTPDPPWEKAILRRKRLAAPPGDSRWIIRQRPVSVVFAPYYAKTWRHPKNSNIAFRQRRTESRPRVTRTENFVKFRHAVFEICKRKDRHTETKIAVLRTPAWERCNITVVHVGFI